MLADHADVTVAHGGRSEGEFRRRRRCCRSARTTRSRCASRSPPPTRSCADRCGRASERWLRASKARVVHDLYGPETLETLGAVRGPPAERRGRLLNALTLDRLTDALRTGHHFMCASERQRDLWLGVMLGQRLIGPEPYDRRPEPALACSTWCRSACPRSRPRRAGTGRAPLGDDAEVVLWNGGIWNWLDAVTAVRAVAALRRRRRRCGWSSWAPPRRRRPRGRRETRAEAAALGCSTGHLPLRLGAVRSARTGCSRPTARSRPTATTSRPASRSARGCSTASGPACRSSAPRRRARRPCAARRARGDRAARRRRAPRRRAGAGARAGPRGVCRAAARGRGGFRRGRSPRGR